MNLLLASVICLAAPTAAPDVAVVCPDEFMEALAPWIAHRQQQGHRIAIVSNEGSPETIRRQIRELAQLGRLQSVLLVGDVQGPLTNQAARRLCIPTYLCEAKVNLRWGSEPLIATDNWYADLDDDQVPDIAIGRLTADSADELTQMVRKILDYERRADFGVWRRRVNFVAGVGGLGTWTDAIIETVAKKLIADGIPAGYRTSMTYASWRSPFCPDPRAFAGVTRERLSEGSLFWVYMGHGRRQSLDLLQVPAGRHRIFDVRDVPQLACHKGSPIALFMACYTGAFDGAEDCLAEALLVAPNAPVAVIAGSRVTMPYAMAVMGVSLLDQCFVQRPETLGEALLAAKRQMVAAPPRASNRALLDLVASAFSPAPDELAAERLEHLQLFNLLGDPLLRLKHPQVVEIAAPTHATAGQPLTIRGHSSIGGRCTIELVARRNRLTIRPPQRPTYDPRPQALESMQATYQQANDRRYTSFETRIEPGAFELTLDVPRDAHGACHVRVFVEAAGRHALGAADVEVQRSQGLSEKP